MFYKCVSEIDAAPRNFAPLRCWMLDNFTSNTNLILKHCDQSSSHILFGRHDTISLQAAHSRHLLGRTPDEWLDRCNRSLCNSAPGARNQDPAPHGLDEWHCLVHCLAPAFYAPALFATDLAFLQVGELPQMVYCVQITNLDKPSTHTLHDFPPGLQATSPMCLPLEQIARM